MDKTSFQGPCVAVVCHQLIEFGDKIRIKLASLWSSLLPTHQIFEWLRLSCLEWSAMSPCSVTIACLQWSVMSWLQMIIPLMHPSIQCHLDNGEMEIISRVMMPREFGTRQKCGIRCKLVTMIRDRDHGVSVSPGPSPTSSHSSPSSSRSKTIFKI